MQLAFNYDHNYMHCTLLSLLLKRMGWYVAYTAPYPPLCLSRPYYLLEI